MLGLVPILNKCMGNNLRAKLLLRFRLNSLLMSFSFFFFFFFSSFLFTWACCHSEVYIWIFIWFIRSKTRYEAIGSCLHGTQLFVGCWGYEIRVVRRGDMKPLDGALYINFEVICWIIAYMIQWKLQRKINRFWAPIGV